MAEVALKKLEDQLNCLVCLDTYTNPKRLQCHHIFCQRCLMKLARGRGRLLVTCPTCRRATPVPPNGVAGLQSAFEANKLLEVLKEYKENMKCRCIEHEERKLELYCETCKVLICLQCITTLHSGHKFKDMSKEHKQKMMTALEQLEIVRKVLEGIDTQEKVILAQKATLEAKIHKENRQLVDAIKARTDQHISKLHHITEQKLRALASQREQIETIKTQLSRGKKIQDFLQIAPLEPLTQADMHFFATTCQNYGEVGVLGVPEPSKCLATGKSLEVATVGERASVILQAFNFTGQTCKEPIKSTECKLVSEITGTRARGSIERRGQSQYEISYQPTIKGRHQLHVKVEGQHIRGSPFSVAVKSPVEKLGTPILTIRVMDKPYDIAVQPTGKVVVSECNAHRVSVFSPSGEKLRSLPRFNYPKGLSIDNDGNILVVDSGHHRIYKLTADLQFLTEVGTEGSGPLQFLYPESIAFNRSNNKVYVCDGSNHRVQVLNYDLTFSSTFGKYGSGKGQFKWPLGIACDSTGNVYVADCYNHRIQVFSAEGKFLRMFGEQPYSSGELDRPVGVAIDTSDMVYVGDSGNHRVCVFTSEGQFVTSFGENGERIEKLKNPFGVAVDSSGVVYVCDINHSCIHLF